MDQARTIWAYDEQMITFTSVKLKGFTGIDPAYPYEVRFYDVWVEE